MKRITGFWLNMKTEEWGIVPDTPAHGEQNADPRTGHGSGGGSRRDQWVEDFLLLVQKKPVSFFVEEAEEFEYIHRCLEKLSIPLAYSPISPLGEEGLPGHRKPLATAA